MHQIMPLMYTSTQHNHNPVLQIPINQTKTLMLNHQTACNSMTQPRITHNSITKTKTVLRSYAGFGFLSLKLFPVRTGINWAKGLTSFLSGFAASAAFSRISVACLELPEYNL